MTAWVWEKEDTAPWLLTSYCQMSFNHWAGAPDWYTQELTTFRAMESVLEIREIELEVEDVSILRAFMPPSLSARGMVT